MMNDFAPEQYGDVVTYFKRVLELAEQQVIEYMSSEADYSELETELDKLTLEMFPEGTLNSPMRLKLRLNGFKYTFSIEREDST